MKIGSFTPVWNQEIFIGPHFDMLKTLDRNVVLMQQGPYPSYLAHGYDNTKDRSEEILREYFPDVEIYKSHADPKYDFCPETYNEGLRLMEECDIVFRLDPDMIFTDTDWTKLIAHIRSTNYSAYRMDFPNDSINYYITWDYEHGLKDAAEKDALAVDPKNKFAVVQRIIRGRKGYDVLGYPLENNVVFKIPNWICHHFRGWNKPKTVAKDWFNQPNAQEAFKKHSNNGKWYVCPEEVKLKMESWRKRLGL